MGDWTGRLKKYREMSDTDRVALFMGISSDELGHVLHESILTELCRRVMALEQKQFIHEQSDSICTRGK